MKVVVKATVYYEVEMDENKFDKDFFDEFNSYMCDYGEDMEEHAMNIAYHQLNGNYNLENGKSSFGSQFIEGYGESSEMGIQVNIINKEFEVIS